jgi:predicted secreted protein
MAGDKGIKLIIKKGVTKLAGVQSKKITYGGEPIDISGDDENGYQGFLPEVGTRSLNFSVEGVTKDTVLRNIKMNTTNHLITDITITYPDGGIIAGDFILASYEESGEHNDAIKFSAEFQSHEDWTYTPPV